ncbi:hypothetical protein F5Y14DRAFT_433951, partial [Nemania sp. NC0429]
MAVILILLSITKTIVFQRVTRNYNAGHGRCVGYRRLSSETDRRGIPPRLAFLALSWRPMAPTPREPQADRRRKGAPIACAPAEV